MRDFVDFVRVKQQVGVIGNDQRLDVTDIIREHSCKCHNFNIPQEGFDVVQLYGRSFIHKSNITKCQMLLKISLLF